MKLNMKPAVLKYAISGAGILCLGLRAALYATGIDGRGLLTENHPLSILLWCLTAAAAAALLLFGRSITGSGDYADAYPVSFAAFLGCIAAAAGLILSGIRSFGDFTTVLDILMWVLGMGSAAALLCIGICRLVRAKPYFLMHTIVCLYFALRLVSQYRLRSADPQLQDYFFYLMAHLALMLVAYHHAAFDAGMGNHRALWITGLSGVYLCCSALYNCEDPLLLGGCALWCFTGLTNLTVRKRRIRPALNTDGDSAQGV